MIEIITIVKKGGRGHGEPSEMMEKIQIVGS